MVGSTPSFSSGTKHQLRRTMLPLNARIKAGCVPVRRRQIGDSYEWDVLLIQTNKNKGNNSHSSSRWIFPKGSVEKGEHCTDAGVRETLEEAGVSGELGPKLGTWSLPDNSNKKKAAKLQTMWILFVHTEFSDDSMKWLEHDHRTREWFSFDVARSLLVAHTPSSKHKVELLEMLNAAQCAISTIKANQSHSKPPYRLLPTNCKSNEHHIDQK